MESGGYLSPSRQWFLSTLEANFSVLVAGFLKINSAAQKSHNLKEIIKLHRIPFGISRYAVD
jgi:hypothetical protein